MAGGFGKPAHHAVVGSEHREREGVQYRGSVVEVTVERPSDRWHKMFREGRENVTDDVRSGRPPTSRGDAIEARVESH